MMYAYYKNAMHQAQQNRSGVQYASGERHARYGYGIQTVSLFIAFVG